MEGGVCEKGKRNFYSPALQIGNHLLPPLLLTGKGTLRINTTVILVGVNTLL